ncbi:MBL fold metallo-hydrolase [Trueperella bialowiezensis]|uniref:Ribonuclease Z n=1 Tax=Trueperella bialowiezensis TaxID=312285 RepID=A0A3S4WHE1_9ACTO|nr:MBL fold metallo-hydrolase [Trueperella bialowiezensis]VEI14003.1 ribonuclease Z [Trueperella bialowiezensis]
MKLTVIGCSGSMSGAQSPASSYLVQAEGEDDAGGSRTWSLVVDFGPGAMGHLMKYVDPARVDAIVISHLHADHCVDLVGMQVYRRWYPEGALSQLPVFSPGDGAERTRGIAGDPEGETYETEFDFQRVVPGDTVQVGPMCVEFFEANHTIEAVSIRITGPSEEDPQRSVVLSYTGDTDYAPTVVEAAQDADVLLSEAAFEEGRDEARGIHLTGKRAGEIATEAGVKRLLLTHLQPWTSRKRTASDAQAVYDGEVTVVSAGDVYTI